MRSMLVPLPRNEVDKALGTKLPYLGLVAVFIVSVIVFLFVGVSGAYSMAAFLAGLAAFTRRDLNV